MNFILKEEFFVIFFLCFFVIIQKVLKVDNWFITAELDH